MALGNCDVINAGGVLGLRGVIIGDTSSHKYSSLLFLKTTKFQMNLAYRPLFAYPGVARQFCSVFVPDWYINFN